MAVAPVVYSSCPRASWHSSYKMIGLREPVKYLVISEINGIIETLLGLYSDGAPRAPNLRFAVTVTGGAGPSLEKVRFDPDICPIFATAVLELETRLHGIYGFPRMRLRHSPQKSMDTMTRLLRSTIIRLRTILKNTPSIISTRRYSLYSFKISEVWAKSMETVLDKANEMCLTRYDDKASERVRRQECEPCS